MALSFEQSGEERTETATSYRREEFRKQGSVAMSRELLSVVMMIAVGLSMYAFVSTFYKQFSLMSQHFFKFEHGTELGRDEVLEMRTDIAKYWGWMSVPVMLVTFVTGLLASVAQVGMYVTFDPLTPNWERINPIKGFGRLFSAQGLVEAVKAFLKIGVVVLVVYYFIKSQAPMAGNYLSLSLPESTSLTLTSLGRLFLTLAFSLLVLSILDYAFQKYQLEKQMKMTKREAKDEFKLREGDPLIKSRIRSVQRRLASRRMMDAVPKADVVVTNPTHLAVALKYDPAEMHAPKVVAKGAGVIAQKIKEIARFHRIPCVENKPLARALFKELDINDYIPRDLYKAVAQVLAYVYRLRRLATAG
jgi:flagellar biosynthesis protein FlhB